MIVISIIIVQAGVIDGFALAVFRILYLNCTIFRYSNVNRHRTGYQRFVRLCHAHQLEFRGIGACLVELDGKISCYIIIRSNREALWRPPLADFRQIPFLILAVFGQNLRIGAIWLFCKFELQHGICNTCHRRGVFKGC